MAGRPGTAAASWDNAEPNQGAAHCYDDQAVQGDPFMLIESIAFIAALFVIAVAILGGLARVCWHSRPQDTGRPHKKPLLSNWK
jgi:hypothetical protein